MKNKDINKAVDVLRNKKNIILQGAPGTGKTYHTASIALRVLGNYSVFFVGAAKF